MRLLIHEFISGGGVFALGDPPPSGSLLVEGDAMAAAVARDAAAWPGAEVLVTRDARLPAWRDFAPARGAREVVWVRGADEEKAVLVAEAKRADAVLLIAPEFDNLLLERARWVTGVGGRLLGPDPEFIALAGDKHAAAETLRRAGVAAPRGNVFRWPERAPDEFYPAVVKPRHGAGSQNTWRLDGPADWRVARAALPAGDYRWEEFHPGLAASVSCLCGPGGAAPLPASAQRLGDDGRFAYLGGRNPLADEANARAHTLATRALAALPPTVGYVGLDLSLHPFDPARDVVIEVNPRLTTSYVALRRRCRQNLVAAMDAAARGEPLALTFDPAPVDFTADGGCF